MNCSGACTAALPSVHPMAALWAVWMCLAAWGSMPVITKSKKKLFEECGMAYAVLNPNQLPTLEALRAAFLGIQHLRTSQAMSLKRQARCLFHNPLTRLMCLTLTQPARPQKPRRQFLAWALARRNRAIKPVALRHRKVST